MATFGPWPNMHRPEITYDPTMPDEIRKAVSPLVEKWAWLAPSWVRTLDVSNETEGDYYARVTTNFDYRRASIFVAPQWLEESNEEREHYLVHEFCHLFQSPLVNWIQRLIDRLAQEGTPFAQELHDRLAEHCEGTTTDLARALLEEGSAFDREARQMRIANVVLGPGRRETDALLGSLGDPEAVTGEPINVTTPNGVEL